MAYDTHITSQYESVPTDVRRLVDKIMDDAIDSGSDLSTEQLMALAVIADRERRARKALALTPKQAELLSFIRLYRTEQGGISPSYDEMREFLGLNSKSGIHRLVVALEERGHIRRLENHSRSIVVVTEAA